MIWLIGRIQRLAPSASRRSRPVTARDTPPPPSWYMERLAKKPSRTVEMAHAGRRPCSGPYAPTPAPQLRGINTWFSHTSRTTPFCQKHGLLTLRQGFPLLAPWSSYRRPSSAQTMVHLEELIRFHMGFWHCSVTYRWLSEKLVRGAARCLGATFWGLAAKIRTLEASALAVRHTATYFRHLVRVDVWVDPSRGTKQAKSWAMNMSAFDNYYWRGPPHIQVSLVSSPHLSKSGLANIDHCSSIWARRHGLSGVRAIL
ncbi:hypothetical protein LZ30DRAFT_104615 [Colletotrichum cereale]|nr:hypothetical protein LZ30DRAFT_104615 [Colletotrichum cereale]